MAKKVLSLCDFTGNMVKPWAETGYECHCIDIQHPHINYEPFPDHGGGIIRRQYDVVQFAKDLKLSQNIVLDFDMVFAFPPCTHLAVSGARWFANKGLQALIDALQIVESCRYICE